MEHYSNSKWKRIVAEEDDEIKKYEETVLNQYKKQKSMVVDDDDLDVVRSKTKIKEEIEGSFNILKMGID